MRFGGHDDLSLSAYTQVMQAVWLPLAGRLEEERPPEKRKVDSSILSLTTQCL
jgi:hypothetical protein